MAAVLSAVSPVTTMLESIDEHTTSPQFCEFESRLGTFRPDGVFVPGVDSTFVANLLCRLETSSAWTEKTPWTQIVDRYYLLPSGLEVRSSSQSVAHDPYLRKKISTSRIRASTSLRAHMQVTHEDDEEDSPDERVDDEDALASYETSHIIKTSLCHTDVKWIHADNENNYGARIGLKHEAPVFEDELQECAEETNMVRIKQRRSFRYTPAGKDTVQWAIDVTQVWHHQTYIKALECLRRGDEPLYEVEVECMDPHAYIQESDGREKRLAVSMLLKTLDLFGKRGELTP